MLTRILTTKDCKELQTNIPQNLGSIKKTWSAKIPYRHINPFTAKFSQKQISTKFPNFILWNFEKQIAPCESTVRELSFEWSRHRIWSTDSKVRVTLQNSIKHSGSERVKFCNADRTTWKLTQDINTTPIEHKTEREVSRRQLFRRYCGSKQ